MIVDDWGTEDQALFEIVPQWRMKPKGVKARRTERQQFLLWMELHPLSLYLRRSLKLHPLAPRDTARPPCTCAHTTTVPCRLHHARRCWTCVHLGKLDWAPDGEPNSSSLKCWYGGSGERVSRGEASTVRAWWPACVNFEGMGSGGDTGGSAPESAA